MDSENFAYRQERTALIISSLPSYIRAIRQNEADEFLKSLMADFIARFPMDLTGVPQSGPLRLTEVTFKTQHPDEMVEIAMKDHLNDLRNKYILSRGDTAHIFAGYDSLLFASAQVLANFTYHFSDQFVDVSDWRREMREVTSNFDIFWRMPVGFAECYGHKRYKWFKGDVDPISTVKLDDDWLYVMPKDLDQELVAQDRIAEQQFIKLRFLKLFEALEKAFQQRRQSSIGPLPKFIVTSHHQPCQMSFEGAIEQIDGEVTERCWSGGSDDVDSDSKSLLK